MNATGIHEAMTLAEAGPIWRESRRPYLSDNAFTRYAFYLRPLQAFFSDVGLGDITPDLIRAYQQARAVRVQASTINHECSCLQQMLKRVGRWQEIASDYQPLPVPIPQCGRALSEQEYKRLFRMAGSNPNWEAAFLFMVLSINTTCGPGEVKTLHLSDVDLGERILTVSPEGAKNPERQRAIPLNQYAYDAAKLALARAQRVGSTSPQHYMFPFRIHKGKYDPERHQTTFKTAWRELTAAADVRNFRMYDLRHHSITSLLENPKISDQTAEALAGHISVRMKRRYSHIRMAAKRAALNAVACSWGES